MSNFIRTLICIALCISLGHASTPGACGTYTNCAGSTTNGAADPECTSGVCSKPDTNYALAGSGTTGITIDKTKCGDGTTTTAYGSTTWGAMYQFTDANSVLHCYSAAECGAVTSPNQLYPFIVSGGINLCVSAAKCQTTDGNNLDNDQTPKICVTGAQCTATTIANGGPKFVDTTNKLCITATACNGAQQTTANSALYAKIADKTAANGVYVCSTSGPATTPQTGCSVSASAYIQDTGTNRFCVTKTQCNAPSTGAGSNDYLGSPYYWRNTYNTPTTGANGVVTQVANFPACVTESTCKGVTNPTSFYTDKTTGNSNSGTCAGCPLITATGQGCSSQAGSCIDPTGASANPVTTPACWICNSMAQVPSTATIQSPYSVLKSDGTCITQDQCTNTQTGLASTNPQYYLDSSNGNQPRCNVCPTNCQSNTVVSSAQTGTCAYGLPFSGSISSPGYVGTCTACNSGLTLKDGSTSTYPKSCVADTTSSSCQQTAVSTVLDNILYTPNAKGLTCTVYTASSVSSASISGSTFNSTPNVVVAPGTNSTDNSAWNIPAQYVKFGAGATNGTVFAYGIKIAYSGGISSISGVVTRTINATTVSNGTDSSEASVISGGSLVSVSWPNLAVVKVGDFIQPQTYPSTGNTFGNTVYKIGTAAVAGYYIVAYSGYVAQWTNHLYAYAWGSAGASTSGQVQLTNIANPAGGAVNYQYTPTNIWLEDNVVYVAFVQTKYTYAAPSGTAPINSQSSSIAAVLYGVGTPAQTDIGAYVAGFNPATGTPFYNDTSGKSSPAKVYYSDGNVAGIALQCGPSNYSNSTTINCLYNAGTDNTATAKYNTYYVSLSRSTGTVNSSAVVVASSSAPGSSTTYPQTTVQFYPAGIVTGAYASGGLFYVKNSTQPTAATLSCSWTYSYGLYWWNTTSGTGVWSSSGLTISGAATASGGTLGNGYYLTSAYDSSSTTYSAAASCTASLYTASTTYQFASFYANGTTNGSTVTVGSLENGSGQYFVDKNGTLWFGYTTQEKSRASTASPSVSQNGLYAGYVGKFQGQLFIATFGNVLSTFFAFLSLILFGLFAF